MHFHPSSAQSLFVAQRYCANQRLTHLSAEAATVVAGVEDGKKKPQE